MATELTYEPTLFEETEINLFQI